MRIVLFAVFFLLSNLSFSQNYPNKPIRLIVGYPPGGSGDFTTRLIADELGKDLNTTIIVENRPGAGGSIASEFVAKAAPDGYTLLNQGNHAINKNLYKELRYSDKDFIPICRIANGATILVVNNDTPFKSARELIAGDTQVMFATSPTVTGFIKGGRMRPLMISMRKASPSIPGIPGSDDAGLPGFESTFWFGLYAPAGTSMDIVRRLHAAAAKGLAKPEIRESGAKAE